MARLLAACFGDVPMNFQTLPFVLLLCVLLVGVARGEPSTPPSLRYIGGDISMLPELERRGAAYRDASGKPMDAIAYLRARGWNLFRVRVFVDPSKDFARTWGATQDLAEVRALSKRIRDAGGELFLCIHYSDTWADPKHQTKPKAWAELPFDALEQRVHDYTADLLAALKEDGVVPAIVQVGNEITAGMLWPDGQIAGDDPADDFARLAKLLRPGIRAVREASTPERPIRIALHVHGGGHRGVPTWFFDQLAPHNLDFDVIALSFYPSWDDDLDVFRAQAKSLAEKHHKDILVAETGYPHRRNDEKALDDRFMRWELTPAGQAQFARELRGTIEAIPEHRGIGIVWWYPEAVPLDGHFIYKAGSEGVFNDRGKALGAIEALGGTD